uniref:3-oxoacyl-[acyl-carrier protein] reductase n=1 Tax=Sphingomonas sp. JE1 TaxID=1628059 RepID=A0A0D5A086_9SPHN|nr:MULTISPECIES: short-chain dehydrogenase/reductase [unclassified Sphingomonas]AJW29593.1 3-oxoacyl-[acyl-carrier protein] reductase [Sphingomonas sp. JE1]
MELGLAGKTALITGGSQGIGLAVATSLAAEGAHLHLVSRNEGKLREAKATLQRSHDCTVHIHAIDLGSSDGIRQAAEAGSLADILINNAGAIPQGDLLAVDEAAWRAAWELKVFGFINLTREIYRSMRQRRSGVIINIIGASGERPKPSYIAGTSGNAALMQFSRALGGESVDHGVRVVGVNPGWIETSRQVDRWKVRAQEAFGDENRWRELEPVRRSPFGRLARPEEVADVITFLSSERASYISGTIVTIDGGRLGRGD